VVAGQGSRKKRVVGSLGGGGSTGSYRERAA